MERSEVRELKEILKKLTKKKKITAEILGSSSFQKMINFLRYKKGIRPKALRPIVKYPMQKIMLEPNIQPVNYHNDNIQIECAPL